MPDIEADDDELGAPTVPEPPVIGAIEVGVCKEHFHADTLLDVPEKMRRVRNLEVSKLDIEYPVRLIVRNTFMEIPCEGTLYFEPRRVQSAPCSPAHRGASLDDVPVARA